MPSAAAKAAYDAMIADQKSKEISAEVKLQIFSESAEKIASKTSQSQFFDQERENSYPRFQINELVLGRVLGRGGYCEVSEIKEINATSETGVKIEQHDLHLEEGNITLTREYLQKACLRQGECRYAIKQLRKEIQTNRKKYKDGIVDLAIEASFLAVLHHPHIVKMRGLSRQGFFNDEGFIIMDRLKDAFTTRINRWKQKESSCCLFGKYKAQQMLERVHVAWDIASALCHMHDKCLIYRDLKPENLGFDVRDDVKLFDFGLAKELLESDKYEDGTYKMTNFTGSVLYMAPEVALGSKYNLSADVYSFGILLWHMIGLETPYTNLSSQTVIEKLVFRKGHRPTCDASWPKDLIDLMEKCWSVSFQQRPDFKFVMKELDAAGSNMMEDKSDFETDLDVSMRSLRGINL